MRNYVLFWGAYCFDQFGTGYSFVSDDEDGLNTQVTNFQNTHPNSVVNYRGKMYFLANNDNVVQLLTVTATHYGVFMAGGWTFLQDGGRTKASPRKTWSHGH